MQKLRVTAREAQTALSIGATKFWALVATGQLAVHRDGPRVYVVSTELQRYIDSCTSQAVGPDDERVRRLIAGRKPKVSA